MNGESDIAVVNPPDEVVLPAAALVEPIEHRPIHIHRRGHPLTQDIRSRVMLYLQQGMSKQAIANRLSISRSTVLRYQQAATQQNMSVPIVRPRGGYRSEVALMDRQQMLQLGELLLKNPKWSIRELKQRAIEANILNADKVPSDTTVWRAIRKLNLDFSKVGYIDPKGSKQYGAAAAAGEEEKKQDGDDPAAAAAAQPARPVNQEEADLIAAERNAFRYVQRQGLDGQLNPLNLIFMDEMNCRTLDQAHYAWGRKYQRKLLFKPKGMSPTFNVIACIGVEEDMPGKMWLHYIIVPPRRDFRGVPTKWKSYEFRNPTAGIDVGYSVGQIQRNLNLDQLTEIMKSEQLRLPQGLLNDETLTAELRRILVQVRTHGKVGMFRDIPKKQRYLGGSIKAFRSTAADVVDYIEKLMVPYYVKRKFQGLVHECNEDSDGVIGCPDAGQHFSVPYVMPTEISRQLLLRTSQRKQRQWQRVAHHRLVYSRSKNSQTEAGQALLQKLETQEAKLQREAELAADAVTRQERQLERAGSFVPFQDEIAGNGYKQRLSKKYLVWDCASTHGAIKIASFRKKSFWHQHASEIGMKGVIFLPPRTPTLNPIELVFGFVKQNIRKNCPDEGYTAVGLIQAIHNAFRRVTPSMITNWVKKCGYRFHSPAEEVREQEARHAARVEPRPVEADDGLAPMDIDVPDASEEEKKDEEEQKEQQQEEQKEAQQEEQKLVDVEAPNDCYSKPKTEFSRKRSIICMDEHGTIIRKKPRGSKYFDPTFDSKLGANLHWAQTIQMNDVAPLVNQMPSVTQARNAPYHTDAEAFGDVGIKRRWSGLGPEPAGLEATKPDSVMKSHDGTLWEIDGIVEHKLTKNGTLEYLVRYKGWGPEYDEWFAEEQLDTAVGAIKEYWARQELLDPKH